MNIDIQAAGTWMKMMRYASPCCASVGATNRPSHRPTAASRAAGTANHHAIRPATGKNDAGEANLNQLIKFELMSIECNANSSSGGERRADDRGEQRRAEYRQLRPRAKTGTHGFDRARAEDQDGNVQR